jgi:hypothetical protein
MRPLEVVSLVSCVTVTAWVTACAAPAAASAAPVMRKLALAEAQFEGAQYAEAKDTFASIDPQCRGWGRAANDEAPVDVRARYALYRGLTFLALGDRWQGSVWLREAWALESRWRGTLTDREVQRLRVAVEANDLP